MVGGENFSLACPHDGDAIVRARFDREWWLRAMKIVIVENNRITNTDIEFSTIIIRSILYP
eukprot:5591630-Pleurochrysis_carterae.AAC.1